MTAWRSFKPDFIQVNTVNDIFIVAAKYTVTQRFPVKEENWKLLFSLNVYIKGAHFVVDKILNW